jgi:hypothetical protein
MLAGQKASNAFCDLRPAQNTKTKTPLDSGILQFRRVKAMTYRAFTYRAIN